MLPIIAYPKVTEQFCEPFRVMFTKPQFENFKRYVSGLIISENVTITGISTRFLNSPDQSNLNRFLTQSHWSAEKLNELCLEPLEKNQATRSKKKGVVIIDDSLIDKTGKKIGVVGKFFDHATSSYHLAQNIVTSHYTDANTSWPINHLLYHKKDEVPRKDFKTKVELAKELIKDALKKNILTDTFVFDSWYLTKEITKTLNNQNKHWVSVLKLNRILLIEERRIPLKNWLLSILDAAFRSIILDKEQLLVFSKCVKLPSLGKVRIVAIHKELDRRDDPMVMATNYLDWDKTKIIRTYKLRWHIEAFYRDAKHNLGFEDAQLRILKGITKHWYLVFAAYPFLLLGFFRNSRLGRIVTNPNTVGAWCRASIGDVLQSLVQFICERLGNNQSPVAIFKVLSACVI